MEPTKQKPSERSTPRPFLRWAVQGIGAAGCAAMAAWCFQGRILGIWSTLGIGFFLLGGALFCLGPVLWKKSASFRRTLPGKIIVGAAAVLSGVFVLFVIGALGYIWWGASAKPEDGATVVVLGCQVNGERPSRVLSCRIETAYHYLQEHPQAKCILSGGKGTNETISEAECMYRELVNKGIDPKRLYREDQSTTTQENLLFSRHIIEEEGLDPRMAIITDWYHEARAGTFARKLGVSAGAVPSPIPAYLTPPLVIREIFALGYYCLTGF